MRSKSCTKLKKSTSVMRPIILSLMALMLTASPGVCFLGGNLTNELKPLIVGQLNQTDRVLTEQEGSLLLPLRTLSLEQVFWTRMAISSLIQGSDESDFILKRLLRNSKDMIETLRPYFGPDKSDQYGDLLNKQMKITVEFVNATRDRDENALKSVVQRWFKNADEVSLLESSAVSGLSPEARKAMWYNLLNLTKNETIQMLGRDHNASIDTFDRIEERAIIMADSLADAIIAMKPERFHEM
jgi:hypothetical protein